jgi:hypothetical protein
VYDWIARALAALAVAALLLLLVGGTFAHDACVDRATGDVRWSDGWSLQPLAWFGAGSANRRETCEKETWLHYQAGRLPLIGEELERAAGGPSNPTYYSNR